MSDLNFYKNLSYSNDIEYVEKNINLNILASEITKKNILDYGCGVGDASYKFNKLSPATITGIDIGDSNIHICENNEYSVYSHISKRQSKKRSITKIANSLGIKSIKLNGNSVDKVFSITNQIVKYVKKFSKPYLIELKTFRDIEHCGTNEDDDLN